MNIFYGTSDIGSVLIGNDDWTFAVPNIGGDGITQILVFDSDEEYKEYAKVKLKFISSVQGNFNIYNYDCAYHNTKNATILTTLNGRYGIYQGEWLVVFVKWGTIKD